MNNVIDLRKKPNSLLDIEIEKLAKAKGYPHIKLSHSDYIQVLKTAHKNVYGI